MYLSSVFRKLPALAILPYFSFLYFNLGNILLCVGDIVGVFSIKLLVAR